MRERQQSDLQQAIDGAAEIADHIDKDQSEIAQLELTLSELVPGLEQARAREQKSHASLAQAEAALADWQQRWDAFGNRVNQAQQTRNVEETRAEQLQSRIDGLAERHRKLAESRESTDPQSLKETFEQRFSGRTATAAGAVKSLSGTWPMSPARFRNCGSRTPSSPAWSMSVVPT